MSKSAALTFAQFAGIQNGRLARIYANRASIEVEGRGEERRFVLRGPSGVHCRNNALARRMMRFQIAKFCSIIGPAPRANN